MKWFTRLRSLSYQVLVTLTALVVFGTNSVLATPLGGEDLNDVKANAGWYDGSPVSGGCTGSPTSDSAPAGSSTTAQGSNLDYAGHPILDQGQLAAIAQNQPVYQQAAQQVGIPWQMLAVIHLRESKLKVANPNDQGIYQFADKHGGPYPVGPVDQGEFLRQSVLAAQFLKQKAASNYPANRNLTTASSGDAVKDTFWSYNGRSPAYAQQAASLGYNSSTQGFEGSPYVMNKADAKRDPTVSPSTWGQVKSDGGPLVYPANSDYGAFITFSALTGGASTSGSCLSASSVNCNGPTNATANLSQVRQNVVCIAQQELALWNAGTLKPGLAGYGKYSQNNDQLWCADFASWVYNQAQYPLQPDPNWRVPTVDGVRGVGEKNQNFHWHPIGGYIPKPGDMVIYKNVAKGVSHVNIVVAVNGDSILTLGGDQGNFSAPDHTIVSQYNVPGYNRGAQDTTGFVSPD